MAASGADDARGADVCAAATRFRSGPPCTWPPADAPRSARDGEDRVERGLREHDRCGQAPRPPAATHQDRGHGPAEGDDREQDRGVGRGAAPDRVGDGTEEDGDDRRPAPRAARSERAVTGPPRSSLGSNLPSGAQLPAGAKEGRSSVWV